MILIYILLTLPLVIHLVVDYKGKVHHKLNAIGVTVLSVLIGLLLPGYWWQGALYALTIHFCFFDPLYNLSHKKNFFYNGEPSNPDRALTDKFWGYFPRYAQIFIRIWVFGVGYAVYHQLPRIISYIP